MTDTELLRHIRLGEDSAWEFKSVNVAQGRVTYPNKGDLADELCAFANSRGGTMLLGVEDDRPRRITGIPLDELDAVETWVRNLCNDSIRPALNAHILKLELTNEEGQSTCLLRVDVERSLHVHEGPHGYFRRIGSSKRKMQSDALARLFQERSQSRVIRYDESPVPDTTRADLDYALTQRFLRGQLSELTGGKAPDPSTAAEDELLRKLRILTSNDDGAERLTLAGTLLCAEEPQRWLPHAYIQAVSYAGERTDIDYQTDARDITGPLDRQVEGALHFVRRNMLVRASKQTARIEKPQFSERAVFEALVNAVAHRDYSMAGARVRLHIFGDRIEMNVPGALVNTLTPDSLHLRQANRNELIVSLLARCKAPSGVGRTHLMDRRGDGVPIIREECEALSGCLPEYSLIDEEELRLIIWAAA